MASDNIVGVTEVKLDLKPITLECLKIKKAASEQIFHYQSKKNCIPNAKNPLTFEHPCNISLK